MSSASQGDGAASESSSKPDFTEDENELRGLANAELKRRLRESPEEIPAGQLLAFAAKVGFRIEAEKVERPQIQNQNIFVAIKGLPEERQLEILNGMQKQIEDARKELPRGE